MTDEQTRSILIISVDEEFTTRLSGVLKEAGHRVLLAHDEPSLKDVFSLAIPELLIIDVGVNGENNIAMLEAIRAQSDQRIALVPVIAASQNGDLVEIAAVIKLGVRDYFVKSKNDDAQILQKIAKVFPAASAVAASSTPASPVSAAISAAATAESRDASSIKVLVIEDDKFLRDLALQKIAKEGFHVVAAVDGEQGVEFAEKEIPDIILLDILLPGIDGFEVLSRVRANPALAKTKVSMLSNFGQREDIEKALKGGADQFMVKANYTLDEIVAEVKKMVATPHKQ